jgi:hypothetical protein
VNLLHVVAPWQCCLDAIAERNRLRAICAQLNEAHMSKKNAATQTSPTSAARYNACSVT